MTAQAPGGAIGCAFQSNLALCSYSKAEMSGLMQEHNSMLHVMAAWWVKWFHS